MFFCMLLLTCWLDSQVLAVVLDVRFLMAIRGGDEGVD